MNIVFAILGITLLVIVHEGGHYIAARLSGMRVLCFSIGLGPVLFKYRPPDSPTLFQVCAIPFLAYVQIDGMNPHEENDPADPELYCNKPPLPRAFAIFAGPAANYIAASVLIFGLALNGYHRAKDIPPQEPMTVERVVEGSPAAEGGMKAGDVIVEAAGEPIRTVLDLIDVTRPRGGQATSYVVERGGVRLPAMAITPKDEGGVGRIGVVAQQKRQQEPLGIGEALVYCVVQPWEITKVQIGGLAKMIDRGSTEGVVGPVGIVKVVATAGTVVDFLGMLILISIVLGMFNLFPLPALDGGRLVFLIYEIVTRRQANQKVEAIIHNGGMLLLLGLIALLTFRDCTTG